MLIQLAAAAAAWWSFCQVYGRFVQESGHCTQTFTAATCHSQIKTHESYNITTQQCIQVTVVESEIHNDGHAVCSATAGWCSEAQDVSHNSITKWLEQPWEIYGQLQFELPWPAFIVIDFKKTFLMFVHGWKKSGSTKHTWTNSPSMLMGIWPLIVSMLKRVALTKATRSSLKRRPAAKLLPIPSASERDSCGTIMMSMQPSLKCAKGSHNFGTTFIADTEAKVPEWWHWA